MDVNVSPGWITYVPDEGTGAGVGGTGVGCGAGAGAGAGTFVADGIFICCPIWRSLGLTPGLAASIAATDIPNFVAIELKVSPEAIVYVEADCAS